MKRKKQNIGLVTSPIAEGNKNQLSNLVTILRSISNDIYFITGNAGCTLFKENKEIHTYGIQYQLGSNAFTKIIRHFYMQLRISYKLIKIAGNVDLWIFFVGSDTLSLPILTLKILRKNVVLVLPGYSSIGFKLTNDRLYVPVKILETINRTLSNHIILYSPNLIKEWNLEQYRNKFSIAHEHFLDFDKFKMKKKFGERDNLVGYIGRLSEEKGILNFVKAIPEISKEKDDLEFLIGGDGQLCDNIKKHLDENNLNDKVNLAGWIPHDKLPDYLNELKLVVLPSYTEGLPNLMLEAMACGTPVLATPVGAIPDVITDGETGFIMEANSPACIAENVMRALEHPDLERIVENARALVEREFTYEAAVERYRGILDDL
ncbi:MAG: glycosyltransferase family 4 protein [Candidatus Thermoplasmatota archaeon]|nr:glycosyltransferase family 4 protein [Candidatus Thermoplasmatota archaeon]